MIAPGLSEEGTIVSSSSRFGDILMKMETFMLFGLKQVIIKTTLKVIFNPNSVNDTKFGYKILCLVVVT